MRSGKLDKSITLQRSSNSIDDFGTPGASWTELATVRAEVIQASTEEFIRDGASDETVVIFRCRYVDGVTTADRVLYEGAYFNIKEVKEIGRRKGLEIRTVRLS